ncbi:FGGY family pentulose kinase [Rhizobium sp. 'Codium 1']|uniref:FGGY family pentulose kinase n=1 Tax=Rhizobium sp. 'Codium 1' TaxID=2940484 RepID=UPI001E4BAEE9|nr:FGGY family pentulose kinase [Rhizobium sp. 'Codium 1']MCC8931961.1 FGGY family pentulose kinase [Rhizobium sp. 'Codium 1']
MREHILAVDVGTGSARAGVFNLSGRQLARHVVPIGVYQSLPKHLEQDSEEIWAAVCTAVRAALTESGVSGETVLAIGFDATCSLVVRDGDGKPISISASGNPGLDTILWMDHRAIAETEACNAIADPVLDRFGGRLSVEMQIPKLLWLKTHRPDIWATCGQIFDLCDYLTWRATASDKRSHSALASKWGYTPEAPGAPPLDYYRKVGLSDVMERAGLPLRSEHPDRLIGTLTSASAAELGLDVHCLVAPGLIDAYAGTVGLFAAGARLEVPLSAEAVLIAGTSSCIVRLSEEPIAGPGCWGGFRDAAVPGLWLTEAGQSASGAFLDHIVKLHPAGGTPMKARHRAILDAISEHLAEEGSDFGLPITVLPDLHGTRSPLSDPLLTGTIAGLDLDLSPVSLHKLYWRSCVALACSIRHIIEHQPLGAGAPKRLLLAGGLADHPLLSQLYADATGCDVHVPKDCDAVLLGCALHAAVAAGAFPSVEEAGKAMQFAMAHFPPSPLRQAALVRDHALLKAMMRHRDELAELASAPAPSPAAIHRAI